MSLPWCVCVVYHAEEDSIVLVRPYKKDGLYEKTVLTQQTVIPTQTHRDTKRIKCSHRLLTNTEDRSLPL